MNRPRIAAIISAVAASTAAFVVTSRYHLGGTLAGAALVPVIIILVSHSSTLGVDALHGWVRRRRTAGADGEQPHVVEDTGLTRGAEAAALLLEAPPADPTTPIVTPPAHRSRAGRLAFSQWFMAGLACVALAVGVYALAVQQDLTVVRQTVIQKVTESTAEEATTVGTDAPDPGGTTTTSDPGTASTTTTEAVDQTATSVTEPTATTVTTTVQGDGTPSTTETTQGSDTSLP